MKLSLKKELLKKELAELVEVIYKLKNEIKWNKNRENPGEPHSVVTNKIRIFTTEIEKLSEEANEIIDLLNKGEK